MRSRKSIAVIAVLIASCFAQTASNIVEPEAIGVVFSVDSATQELKRLPSETWNRFTKLGFPARATDMVRIEGAASTFRMIGGDKVLLVFGGMGDDIMKVKMFACRVKDGRREYDLGLSKGRNYAPNPGVTATLAKYGSSFKLTPDQPLGPGEYAVVFGTALFTFGVNAAAK